MSLVLLPWNTDPHLWIVGSSAPVLHIRRGCLRVKHRLPSKQETPTACAHHFYLAAVGTKPYFPGWLADQSVPLTSLGCSNVFVGVFLRMPAVIYYCCLKPVVFIISHSSFFFFFNAEITLFRDKMIWHLEIRVRIPVPVEGKIHQMCWCGAVLSFLYYEKIPQHLTKRLNLFPTRWQNRWVS